MGGNLGALTRLLFGRLVRRAGGLGPRSGAAPKVSVAVLLVGQAMGLEKNVK